MESKKTSKKTPNIKFVARRTNPKNTTMTNFGKKIVSAAKSMPKKTVKKPLNSSRGSSKKSSRRGRSKNRIGRSGSKKKKKNDDMMVINLPTNLEDFEKILNADKKEEDQKKKEEEEQKKKKRRRRT